MSVRILNPKNITKPFVVFTSKAVAQLFAMLSTKTAETLEFMFMGEVQKEVRDKKTIYKVTNFVLIPQEKNSGAYCETDDERYPEWLNKNYPTIEQKRSVRLHGHSHVNMAVSPSGTDNENMMNMMEYVSDYFIQFIINRKYDTTINIYDKSENIVYEGLEPHVLLANNLLVYGIKDPELLNTPEIDTSNLQTNQETRTLFLNKNITLDLESLRISIFDDNLILDELGLSLTDQRVLDIDTYEEQLKSLIKKPPYYSTSPLDASPLSTQSTYYYDNWGRSCDEYGIPLTKQLKTETKPTKTTKLPKPPKPKKGGFSK